jgi:D-3-phosphoglycerate dehydrogenase
VAQFKIVTQASGANYESGGLYHYEMEALARLDVEIVEADATENAFISVARDADAIYGKGLAITQRIIDSLDKCKVISLGSVGVDSVDVAAATERGIPVTNVPDTFIEEVADHTMTLLLAGHRRLLEQDRMVREGRWKEGRPQLYQFPRLTGSTLGLIAFGHIPRQVALRAKPFGLRIIACDPFVEELVMSSYGVEPVSLNELLERSDFVSMHAPGTPDAKQMLGEAEFRRMKQTAMFVNTGRGATVQEPALIRALREGWIAHAALDVLEIEPPKPDNPLLKMDNVTLTAHVASASARFDPARKRRVGLELAQVLSGRWPLSCVNPAVLERSGLKRWQPVSMERGPNS